MLALTNRLCMARASHVAASRRRAHCRVEGRGTPALPTVLRSRVEVAFGLASRDTDSVGYVFVREIVQGGSERTGSNLSSVSFKNK